MEEVDKEWGSDGEWGVDNGTVLAPMVPSRTLVSAGSTRRANRCASGSMNVNKALTVYMGVFAQAVGLGDGGLPPPPKKNHPRAVAQMEIAESRVTAPSLPILRVGNPFLKVFEHVLTSSSQSFRFHVTFAMFSPMLGPPLVILFNPQLPNA